MSVDEHEKPHPYHTAQKNNRWTTGPIAIITPAPIIAPAHFLNRLPGYSSSYSA